MSLQLQDPCLVCSDCKGSLMSSSLTLPRHSLANDLWMGEQLPALRGLASATKRLLPMTRACMQVVVLQPGHCQNRTFALQLRGDCNILRFKQIQLIWTMRCWYLFMAGRTLGRENCTSTIKCTWTALQKWAAISGAICHYLGCMNPCSISHCITFCFQMKKQEMMPTHYGSWCWRIPAGSAHIVGHDSCWQHKQFWCTNMSLCHGSECGGNLC